jgi:hypothetical protein
MIEYFFIATAVGALTGKQEILSEESNTEEQKHKNGEEWELRII